MFYLRFVLALIATLLSQVFTQNADSSGCKEVGKFCENIWYCKSGSYPDNYVACGHDGLVDRVCCEPTYKRTKSRIYCDTFYKKIVIDEYGNTDFKSIVPIHPILTENVPHAAALGVRKDAKTNWTCAGSLVNDKYIITAAACLNESINIVRLGDLDLNRDDDNVGPQEYGIARQFIHPKYIAPFVYNDLALLELNDTVKFSKFVKPVCLHDDKKLREFFLREGGYERPGNPEHLTVVALVPTARRACKIYVDSKRFANQLPFGFDENTQLCASTSNTYGSCQMNIGGPLDLWDLNYVDGRFLAGVTSIPKPCTFSNEPGIYTRISNYVPWIESIIFPDA